MSKTNSKPLFNIITFVMVILAILAVFIFATLFAVITDEIGMETKQQAIERGYALHCPKGGEFAWKGECDE